MLKALLSSSQCPPSMLRLFRPWQRCSLCTSSLSWAKKRDRSLSEKQERFLRKKELKAAASKKVVQVWSGITPALLAANVARTLDSPCKPEDILELVLDAGGDVSDEHSPIRDAKLLSQVTRRMGIRVTNVRNPAEEAASMLDEDKAVDAVSSPVIRDKLMPRWPVVAIMGHVDHGKTTLLDYLRKSNVVAGEAGGITQHIGAFVVRVDEKAHITFIDTPGHAAFRSMRERGADTTDLAVLVVSAVEGVLPQTIESVRMIRAAPNCSMVVAINKIDIAEPEQIESTKQELYTKAGIHLEEMGGDTQAVAISAKSGENVDQLIEALLVQAELLQLQAEREGVPVEGVVLESRVEQGLGKTATVLIKRGSLSKGNYLVCEQQWCRIRVMQDDKGVVINRAGPSQPVKVSGWRENELPPVGAIVLEVESERRAQEVVRYRRQRASRQKSASESAIIAEQRRTEEQNQQLLKRRLLDMGMGKMHHGIVKSSLAKEMEREHFQMANSTPKVSYLVKADVDGSLEAIMDCVNTYDHNEEVLLDLVDKGVGEVSVGDVELAASFSATIYAFNAPVAAQVQKAALDQGVTIKQQQVIYQLVDDLKSALSAQLPPVRVEDVTSSAMVQKEFTLKSSNKNRKPPIVAGCLVERGTLEKRHRCKVLRNKEVLYDGKFVSLKHLKDEVEFVDQGRECGIIVDDPELRFKPGDQIVCYTERYEKQYTKWNPGF